MYKSNADSRLNYTSRYRRNKAFKTVLLGLLTFFLVISVFLIVRTRRSGNSEKELLMGLWETAAFDKTYAISVERLEQNHLDFFLLTLRGFSAYQLAISQISAFDTQKFIDDAIVSLRKVMLLPEAQNDGRVYYMLGKAYYEKGASYTDLAIKYLEEAIGMNYRARDIPQYLGLSYAAVQDFRSSVAAFSLALNDPEVPVSDSLLLAIANSYHALGEVESAVSYLFHCIETSRDSHARSSARMLLGRIFTERGDIGAAEIQFRSILEETGENADARFYLGELYYLGGDSTRARAEWRNARRIDPAHRQAIARLNY